MRLHPLTSTYLTIILLAAGALCASTMEGEDDYDLYVLAQEWYGNVCHVKDCYLIKELLPTRPFNHFNLHGLWPSKKHVAAKPSECARANQVSLENFPESLKNELNVRWNGLYNPTEGFLQHEWSKHGTCWDGNSKNKRKRMLRGDKDLVIPKLLGEEAVSENAYNDYYKQVSYFWTALQLAANYNIYQLLENQGIAPSRNTMKLGTIRQALREALNIKDFVISCEKGKVKHSSNAQDTLVFEIRVCYDLHYVPTNCPEPVMNFEPQESDDTDVYYLPLGDTYISA